MPNAILEPGVQGEATLIVGDDHLASTLGASPSDAFPAVFATARMIGLMEVAAARAMQSAVGPGELSVGVHVDVSHSAPTPLGARVRASAVFRALEGKLYVFDVVAEDEAGEIGRGQHKRAVIVAERLVAGAARRRSGPA